MTALLSVRNLGVTYGDGAVALRDVGLDVLRGECLAVIGESGSGKTTLARAIAGLLPENARMSGSVTWPGLPEPVKGRDVGYVFQDPAASLDPVMPVGEQIAEVAAAHLGVGWREARRIAVDLAARVLLPQPAEIVRAYPHQLSGGQRQRVAIAAAIAARPRLLIADEATSALDTIVQAEIVALIRRLFAEDGMTLLMITHDIALASQLADRMAVFRSGELVEIGPASRVVGAPEHPYTLSLVDAHLGLDAAPLFGVAGVA